MRCESATTAALTTNTVQVALKPHFRHGLERHHPSALYDVIFGNNRYERRVPGHSAHRGYDLATGVECRGSTG
jgi:hypothetical protein